MGDPVTWMMVASTVIGTGATVTSGIQQSNQAEAEADLANQNAKAAAQQAAAAEDATRRRSRSILARQRAAIAESGIGFGGSSEVLQQDSAVQAELDALNVRYEGRLRGLGLRADANIASQRGRNAMTGSVLSATGQLLGGGADAYAMKRT